MRNWRRFLTILREVKIVPKAGSIRQSIYFDREILVRLKAYCKNTYPNRRVMSAIINCAVMRFLDAEKYPGGDSIKKRKPVKRYGKQ